jgi:phosphatidate phosphatase APP1
MRRAVVKGGAGVQLAHILTRLAGLTEGRLNTLKQALSQRWGAAPTCIVAYHGYGTSDCLMLKGRVLEDRGIRPADATDSAWRNLRNMYRRFDSDAIPGARLLVGFDAVEQTMIADDQGFFAARLVSDAPLPHDRLWHSVELILRAPHPA